MGNLHVVDFQRGDWRRGDWNRREKRGGNWRVVDWHRGGRHRGDWNEGGHFNTHVYTMIGA